jgi:hypothetical protein
MKRVIRRPSPAMIVAIVALIAALGGTAVAGGFITKKKAKNIANNVVTQRAPGLAVGSAKTADSAKNSDALGGLGASSFQGRVRWAFVAANGAILAQSGGISNDGHNTAACPTGCDFLNFGSSQADMALLATDNDVGQVRPLLCGGSGPGNTNCSTGNNSSHILVRSYDSAGSAANQGYWIAVVG